MSDNNVKFKWLKFFHRLFVFALLSSTVCAENTTDYSDDEMDTFILIQPAPESIPQCGVNEVYQSCEVNCIDCEKRGICEAENCDISHCDCKINFVHLTQGGPCEHVSVCPPRECPENEVYRHCGPYCEYCDMPQCRTLECSSRCYCKQGYRRNKETEKCIPEKECSERLDCPSGDAVAKNGPASEHCMQTEFEALRVNETIEEEKCYCPSGFKRNMHGWCIDEEFCSFVTCTEQTEFQDCPRKCNTTCWNYGDPNCQEDGQCYPSCFCPEGYVLNEFFACIPLEMCPPGSNPFVPTLPPPTVGPIPEPALEGTSEASTATKAEAASSSSGAGSGSAEAASSSSETGSGSAEAASSSSGTGSSSAEAASSSSGTGSSSASAASSSSATGGSSVAAAESSSGTGGSSAAVAESSSGTRSSSASMVGDESSSGGAKDTEKTKESEAKETTPVDKITEAPKKHPKKATSEGKVYKSAAKKGKTVAPTDEDA